MIEALRSVRYTVGDLAVAQTWYSQWLDMQPCPVTEGVLRYDVDGSWLDLVEDPAHQARGSVQAYWGVDSLGRELERLHALGINPQTPPALLGAGRVQDPHAQRARDHRAAEKIALRKVRETLDKLDSGEDQQRMFNRFMLALVVVVGLLVGSFTLVKTLSHKPQEDKIVLPIPGKK